MGPLFSSPFEEAVSYFAIFDGHAGARAAHFAAERLHHVIAAKFPPGLSNPNPPYK